MQSAQDGIEIHFDEEHGHLRLACEPDAFSDYCKVVREHLKDFPEISIDQVIELNIIDSARLVARRGATKRVLFDYLFGAGIIAVLLLAMYGAFALIKGTG